MDDTAHSPRQTCNHSRPLSGQEGRSCGTATSTHSSTAPAGHAHAFNRDMVAVQATESDRGALSLQSVFHAPFSLVVMPHFSRFPRAAARLSAPARPPFSSRVLCGARSRRAALLRRPRPLARVAAGASTEPLCARCWRRSLRDRAAYDARGRGSVPYAALGIAGRWITQNIFVVRHIRAHIDAQVQPLGHGSCASRRSRSPCVISSRAAKRS